MPVREGPPEPAPPPREQAESASPQPYPAEKTRGGTIVLRSRTARIVFVAGLAGAILLVMLAGLLA